MAVSKIIAVDFMAYTVSLIRDIKMIKVVLLTLTVTIAALSLAFSIFMNTILGAFGLVTTSVDAFNNMKDSQAVVEKMKERHEVKKAELGKNFAKKSSKKVASTVAAAATVGAVGVAITAITFEVSSYCESQKSLNDDYNLLYNANEEFDFKKCLATGKDQYLELVEDVKESAKESLTQAVDSSTEFSKEKWSDLKAKVNATSEAGVEWWDFIRDSFAEDNDTNPVYLHEKVGIQD